MPEILWKCSNVNGMEEISSSSPTLFLSYSLTMTIVTIPNLSRWFINKTSSTATSRYFFLRASYQSPLWPALDFVSWKFIQFILYIKLKVSGHTQQKSDVTSQTLFLHSFIEFSILLMLLVSSLFSHISDYCWLSTHYFSNSTKKYKVSGRLECGRAKIRASEQTAILDCSHATWGKFGEKFKFCCVLRKIQWLLNSCVSGWDGPMLSWVWIMGNWWFSTTRRDLDYD